MEKLELYDPLALTAIEFNIKHIKKYTSIATILLSAGLMALTAIINIDSLSHFWIPRAELPVTYSLEKYGLKQFSALPACVATDGEEDLDSSMTFKEL